MLIGQSINKRLKIVIVSITLILATIFVYILLKSVDTKLVSAKEFSNLLKSSKVEKIYIKDDYLILDSNKGRYKTLSSGLNLNKIFANYPVAKYKSSNKTLTALAVFLLLLILITLILLLNKRDSKDTKIPTKDDIEQEPIVPQLITDYSVNFKSLAGIEYVVDDLKEIVDFIKEPQKYKDAKIKMPKGLLLVGPPGVGKTMIAKAIANEAGVPLFYQSGATFVQIYAGMGPKRVKELFSEAKKLAPSIIFIDEIDAIGKSRELLKSDEREATLNQLLVEMDGFEDSNILVIGATNRVDVLDSALLRPGRFDRHIYIELPNLQDRIKIIKHYLQGKIHSLDIEEVAKMTSGFSPASLEILINEASLNAFREKRNTIKMSDIEAVKDRVVYGKRKMQLLSKEEKEISASLQAAKAVSAVWLGFKFDKVSLLSSLAIDKDGYIYSKDSLENLAKVNLSGYYYLLKRYNNIFSITKDDINSVKELLTLTNSLLIDEKIDIEYLKEETISLIDSLNSAIDKVSNLLLESERLSYNEVKSVLDDIF